MLFNAIISSQVLEQTLSSGPPRPLLLSWTGLPLLFAAIGVAFFFGRIRAWVVDDAPRAWPDGSAPHLIHERIVGICTTAVLALLIFFLFADGLRLMTSL